MTSNSTASPPPGQYESGRRGSRHGCLVGVPRSLAKGARRRRTSPVVARRPGRGSLAAVAHATDAGTPCQRRPTPVPRRRRRPRSRRRLPTSGGDRRRGSTRGRRPARSLAPQTSARRSAGDRAGRRDGAAVLDRAGHEPAHAGVDRQAVTGGGRAGGARPADAASTRGCSPPSRGAAAGTDHRHHPAGATARRSIVLVGGGDPSLRSGGATRARRSATRPRSPTSRPRRPPRQGRRRTPGPPRLRRLAVHRPAVSPHWGPTVRPRRRGRRRQRARGSTRAASARRLGPARRPGARPPARSFAAAAYASTASRSQGRRRRAAAPTAPRCSRRVQSPPVARARRAHARPTATTRSPRRSARQVAHRGRRPALVRRRGGRGPRGAAALGVPPGRAAVRRQRSVPRGPGPHRRHWPDVLRWPPRRTTRSCAALLTGLPVAGFDRHARRPLPRGGPARRPGVVRAKTGTLTGVSTPGRHRRARRRRLLAFASWPTDVGRSADRLDRGRATLAAAARDLRTGCCAAAALAPPCAVAACRLQRRSVDARAARSERAGTCVSGDGDRVGA